MNNFALLLFLISNIATRCAAQADSHENTFFERKLDLSENTPNPFFTNESTYIKYKAISAYTFSIIVFNNKGEKVLRYGRLSNEQGEIKINANALMPGNYKYALVVNGKMVCIRKMTVLASAL